MIGGPHLHGFAGKLLLKFTNKTGESSVKLFHRSPVNRRCSEFLQFPTQVFKEDFRGHLQSPKIWLVRGLVKFVLAVVQRAGTNFTKPRTSHIFGLCTYDVCIGKGEGVPQKQLQ